MNFELALNTVTVGRSKANLVQINEANVSGRHAELYCHDGAWYCRDLHSTNGTHVNGERLIADRLLHDGDFITFASIPGIYRAETAMAPLPGFDRLETGMVLDRQFQLGDFLGEGPGCENFRATDLIHGTTVVIKKFFREAVVKSGGLAAAGQETARIQGVPHPNMISPIGLRPWPDGGVMQIYQWLDSASLMDVLRARGTLTPSEALQIMRPVASVVDHARLHKLVGLDLNPRPILMNFECKPTPEQFKALPNTKLENWPPFTMKINPLLAILDEPGSPGVNRVARGDTTDLTSLALLICELFGYAVPQGGPGGRKPGRVIIPALGDSGNAVLGRALASTTPDFEGAVDFITRLESGLRL
jgi:serine/threonine protein kinase